MTRRLVRMIGGVAAGQEIWSSGGPALRVPKHPDFVACPVCLPEATPANVNEIAEHYEEYEIHRISFGEGYVHHYGYPVRGASAAHALNEMWHVYSKASREHPSE